MPYPPLKDHGLAHRYLDGYHGIEIGGSSNNPFNIPGCVNVDFSAEQTRFKDLEIELCGRALPVDVVAEADSLPFDDSSQDYVVNSHVIEHLPDPIKAIKEWVRVVRPGGIILLIIPHGTGIGAHKQDLDKPITTLDHLAEDHARGETVDTHPIPDGHEIRGHYHVFSYASFKAFVARFFADTLEWFDGEPIDSKVANGHTHVLRVIKPTADGSPRVDIKPTRKRVWINMPDETGCTYYRQHLPYAKCKDELAARGIDLIAGGIKGNGNPDSSHDAYVLQRATGPMAFTFLHWIKKCERKIAWDLDDDFLAIPEWSPAHKAVREDGSLQSLPVFLDLADAITVTNEHLAGRIEEELDFTKGKLNVLPNLIDAAKYEHRPRPDRRIPRVLWTGSAFHAADLDLLVPVVERLIAHTEWEIVFVGDMPAVLRGFPEHRVWQTVGAQIRYYPRLLCDIAADVALVPVTGSTFDASKSAIKWMECTLAGSAVVATDFGPYAAAIEHERTGLLVSLPNDPDAWVTAILKAFVSRRELQAAAQEEVLAKHSWQSPEARQKWIDFFVRITDQAA